MEEVRTIASMRAFEESAKSNNGVIGLVPTMGALHEGHLSLIRYSKQQSTTTVVSIFVNPTQFNNKEDFENYPISMEQDLKILRSEGVDAVFIPTADEMYPEESKLSIGFGSIENVMEGKFRKGHFAGVGLVVSKLFNIIRPHKAFFGQKDLQQLTLIKMLERNLNFGIEIIDVPTVRESDGLAMSSRNRRLSRDERMNALKLHEGLQLLQNKLLNGSDIPEAVGNVEEMLSRVPNLTLEYLEVVDSLTLEKVDTVDSSRSISLCIAAYLGKIRLLDNIYLKS